jgi:hypothetical protein
VRVFRLRHHPELPGEGPDGGGARSRQAFTRAGHGRHADVEPVGRAFLRRCRRRVRCAGR